MLERELELSLQPGRVCNMHQCRNSLSLVALHMSLFLVPHLRQQKPVGIVERSTPKVFVLTANANNHLSRSRASSPNIRNFGVKPVAVCIEVL